MNAFNLSLSSLFSFVLILLWKILLNIFHSLLQTTCLSVLHFEWLFYPGMVLCHHALADWKILVHWVKWISQMLTNFFKQLSEYPICSYHHQSEKSWVLGSSQLHSGGYKFSKHWISYQNSNFIIGSTGWLHSVLRKCLPKHSPKQPQRTIHSGENGAPGREWHTRSQLLQGPRHFLWGDPSGFPSGPGGSSFCYVPSGHTGYWTNMDSGVRIQEN